jgi:DNA-binding MurR/RpiR family transcriptional regulator
VANDLFQKITILEPKLNGKLKKLAHYLISHFEEISFQTVAEVASKSGVSGSTVIRLSRALGYDGFPHLQAEFQTTLLEKLSPSERFHKAIGLPSDNFEKLVSLVFEKEVQNLRDTEKQLEIGNITKIANCIIKAKTKYILGLRGSSGSAYLLGRYLNQILPHIIIIQDGDSRLFETLKGIGKDDILVTVSYPRYTKAALEAIKFARNRKAITVAITDSKLSPAVQLCQFSIVATANSSIFTNSYVACTAIVNLLLTLIMHINKVQTQVMLKEWENAIAGFNFHPEGF